MNIFLIGPMGAGKSTIGRQLAKILRLDFFDTDQVIEERTGADLAWIYDIEGEAGFQKREEQVVDDLTRKQSIILATGGGVVLSAKNRAALRSRGSVIYLQATIEQQMERTRRDTKRPLLREKDGVQERLGQLREELLPFYKELADYTFETDGFGVRSVAEKIAEALLKEKESQ